MQLDAGVVVTVTPPEHPKVGVTPPMPSAVTIIPAPGTPGRDGQPGPPGPAGGARTGGTWFVGVGPPNLVIGSQPGDYYLDESTGTIYQLNGGI